MTSRQEEFAEIPVERINVREPDGRLRCVISNSDRFPGLILRGGEYEHSRPQAGLLFFNDEQTENGGLIFDGADGSTGGSLTFDAYEQDQMVQLLGVSDADGQIAGLIVTDRPQHSLVDQFEQRSNGAAGEPAPSVQSAARRVFVGAEDGDALLNLCDGEGNPRLRLRVGATGESAIEFLDASGSVISALSPPTD
jgi:hypothetical protein